ncbi:MAG TPA: excinuclease ABC subunit UvrB [Bacilli bacterium]|nr:excinuclease ABC subunit UvrB [Acholeplasmataceae bacterium]HNZ77805.1 excinuclease ABC subunit UvrB [Bacilli bacterium]HOD60926.1 excinuclease ABC subunit UvrB [Bacilli bacterium]HOH61088.1 excinuclease ABC subunit UvrB [Bacilli bacterium]HPB48698.1 excinuclease ABC subunit UvrB [Bacilli bacterium]
MMFKLHSQYQPTGDQPLAIDRLTENINKNVKEQTLLGATGTGKTFTIANVIKNTGKKTLVLAHNKTLAGQLYSELKGFFPENKVEYFISYYDYYQPEAYVASKDLYIEKDSSINDDIDQMRHSAVSSLLSDEDVIVVASVSCIYGIGDPEDYRGNMLVVKQGQIINREEVIEKLISMQYSRNDYEIKRGTFRVKGDTIDVIPAYEKSDAIRLEFFDNEIEKIKIVDVITGKVNSVKTTITFFPATLFTVNEEKKKEAIKRIRAELETRIAYFKNNGQLLETQRIESRTNYDLEMLEEIGICSGIENYSRHMSLREEGEMPYTLIDFFGKDFLLVVDESHVTLPQVRGMYNGDRSRKMSLVDNGFRLPSALDNRPLTFEEFNGKLKQIIYVSATPGDYEISRSSEVVEQIIRPTGLLDPVVEVRPTLYQIDDLVKEINKRVANHERTLVVTLTIKMSEDLTKYLKELGIKVTYLHSEVKSLERLEIIRSLRQGTFDVLVGINLLREGLDIPEVSLIAILDADKEGFLRSETSLIQTIGRAARNAHGKVIMYADKMTESMDKAITETYRRREIQHTYNIKNNIEPQTIYKEIADSIVITEEFVDETGIVDMDKLENMSNLEKKKLIKKLEIEMKEAAKNLDFEQAMSLRDIIFELKASL